MREEVGDSVDMFRIDGEEESESKGFDLTPALSSKRGGIVGSPFESLANRFVGRPPGEQVWAATQRRPCQSGNAPRQVAAKNGLTYFRVSPTVRA